MEKITDPEELEKRRKELDDDVYHITQEAGTEPPGSGKLLQNHANGIYRCVVCQAPIFSSDTKFDSGSGWPSFSDVLENENIKLNTDRSGGMIRTEIRCGNCDAHLGHVFADGPTDPDAGVPATGKRYCVNSTSLDFEED